MISLEHINFNDLMLRETLSVEKQLQRLAQGARVFRNPLEPYLLCYRAAAASFPTRRDELDVRRASRLPMASRGEEYRISALQRLSECPRSWSDVGDTLRTAHSALTGDFLDKSAGCYRDTEMALAPHIAGALTEYQAPPSERIVEEIDRLGTALELAADTHPLAAIIVFYAGTILLHPFSDGNGRVTRICVEKFLHSTGLLPEPFLCIEGAFRRHDRANGFRLTKLNQNEDWTTFSKFFHELLMSAIREAEQTIKNRVTQIVSRFE